MAYPTFAEHIRATFGKNWVVHARRTARIVEHYGDDVAVLTPTRYDREQQAWAAKHPAMLMAESLPDSDEKRFICKAVWRALA